MIKKFFVKNLFGMYDNEINFKEEKITAIIGPNGCGKTTMLKILEAVFSQNHSKLFEYKFDYIEIKFIDHLLKIELYDEHLEEEDIMVKSLKYFIDGKELDRRTREDSKIYSPHFWVRAVPYLRRRPGNVFMDSRSGELLTLTEVITEYFDTLSDEMKDSVLATPVEVYDLISSLQIELISTDRLKKISQYTEYGRREVVEKYAVEEYAEDLKNTLKNKLSEYANISQKLDEQFLPKILEVIKQKNPLSLSELEENIHEIDELRKKHVSAGVLEESDDKFLNIKDNLEGLEPSIAAILKVYYQDIKKKLESLNDISDRIALFKKMITNKFNKNKEISIDGIKGISLVQKHTGEPIELKNLSSGEQQEFVLLYNLIFNGSDDKLILIDEPELSLNVLWQREFLDDMKKIVNINNFSVLIATHSPQIINENWKLVEEIGEPK